MNLFKKVVAVLIVILSIFLLFSCKDSSNVVAVIQYGSSDALDDCYEGFKEEFEDNPDIKKQLKFEFFNANFDRNRARDKASEYVKRRVKAIVAIGEGAVLEVSEAASGSEIPVVWFGLVDDKPVSNKFNTSGIPYPDKLEQDLRLLSSFFKVPSLRVGVVTVNTSANGVKQITRLKELGNDLGIMIYDSVATKHSEIFSAVEEQVSSYDRPNCFLIINDDYVMAKAEDIIKLCSRYDIPVFGNTEEQIEDGAIAGYVIDYESAGRNLAKKVIDVHEGRFMRILQQDYGIGLMIECYNPEVADLFYKKNKYMHPPINVDYLNIVQ